MATEHYRKTSVNVSHKKILIGINEPNGGTHSVKVVLICELSFTFQITTLAAHHRNASQSDDMMLGRIHIRLVSKVTSAKTASFRIMIYDVDFPQQLLIASGSHANYGTDLYR